jgi:hypothetical protein
MLMLLSFSPLKAQHISADSSSFLMGQQVNLTLELNTMKDAQVNWPFFTDTLTRSFEVVKAGRVDTLVNASGDWTLTQVLTITSFDTGFHAIPPIPFAVRLPGAQEFSQMESEPLLLEVKSVSVDQTADIKDLKPILRVPYTFADFLPWMLGLLVVALLAALIWFFIWSRKNNKPLLKIPSRPPPPAHVIALSQLEELKKKQLWQKGQIKEYHTRLTDILRRYLEAVYTITAAEMTSYEILQAMKQQIIEESRLKELKKVLELADMAKFAKARPMAADNELSFNLALNFIKSTAPAPKEQRNGNQQVAEATVEQETEKMGEHV